MHVGRLHHHCDGSFQNFNKEQDQDKRGDGFGVVAWIEKDLVNRIGTIKDVNTKYITLHTKSTKIKEDLHRKDVFSGIS